MDVWVNGEKVECENSFVEDGTEITFPVDNVIGTLKAQVADKKKGVLHQLYLEGKLVEEEIIF